MEKLSTEELEHFLSIVGNYDNINDLSNSLVMEISKRKEEESKSLNVRFNMELFEELQIFDPWEFKVIKDNHINNLQELIDCNLDSLVGITQSTKQGLDWARHFYDMEKGKPKR